MASAAAAKLLLPTVRIADTRPKQALSELVPERLGDWVVDRSIPVILPSPDVQANLDKVYNQVLSASYINPKGYRIMLSIAYGGDQSDGLNVHRPEVCYPAQGFEVGRVWSDSIQMGDRVIPVSRATTKLGPRNEPLTYWIINGDEVIGRGYSARFAQLKYTLRGKIPDGMLVRVSSIDQDTTRAFAQQDDFSRSLVGNVDPAFRTRIAGRPSV
jgi:EpsI family protein